LNPEIYLDQFYRHTRFKESIERYAPYILEEVQAVARAADAPFPKLLAIQHLNEEFWLVPKICRELSPLSDNRCSTIVSCASDSPTLVCHNLDLPAWYDDHQFLLHYQGESPDTYLIGTSVPGQLHLNGVNNYGIAVADNALLQLNTSTDGLPVFAIYRCLLEQNCFQNAIHFLTTIKHASGINWAVGAPGFAAMYESSASKIVRYSQYDQETRLFHTNHPIVNDDQSDYWRRIRRDIDHSTNKPDPSTYLRFASLEQRLANPKLDLSIPLAKQALSAQDDPQFPVSVESINDNGKLVGITLSSTIFDVSTAVPRIHISAGPPHKHGYGEVILSN